MNEISATKAATALGISLRAVQARIIDGQLQGRRNRLTGRMWTTPDACIAYIRTQCGHDSGEEKSFIAAMEGDRVHA